ncbi:MAG TPA: SDR family oxidoreductase [Longimicrobium sp.]|nr:SDR family oxidoreductase [Longimicrobium sp.]
MRILITGGAGLLGSELIRTAPAGAQLHVTQRTTPVVGAEAHVVDLAEAEAVDEVFGRVRPEVVIHTAYTPGEGERDIGRATESVVAACARAGAGLVHISTDRLFDGELAPYAESDTPAPLDDYGRWKAHAETVVRTRVPDAAVVRISLIVRAEPPDRASAWVLDGIRRGEPPTLFVDELRCPIGVEDAARMVWEIAMMPAERRRGIWHLAGPEAVSRYALGVLLALRAGLDPARIAAAPSSASPVRRPRDLRLLTTRADRELRTRARPVTEVLFPGSG